MNQPRSLSKLISTNTLQHAGYLAVAKTRAKALKAFSYVVPVRRPMLFVGEESCDELCDMLINENNSNVFIVTDAVLNSLGIPAKVTNYLDSKGISYHVYDGVTPDPTFTVVENGIDQYAEEKCDSIVAIGGGSVIDAAKMIAMSQGNQCQPQQLIGILKSKKTISAALLGGVLKSMLASDVAIIDVKEHHIKHFEVIIELLREATSLSNRSS